MTAVALNQQQVLEPTARVRVLAEKAAQMVEVDSNIPIRRYFRSGKEIIKMADVYYDEKDWERAFILYNKYITLFVEKLPKQHPEYKQSRVLDVKECRKTLKSAFPKAEETKGKVREKFQADFDIWLANEKIRKEEEAQLEEIARQKEEDEHLQKEREEALGEEERLRLREERERLSLEEQKRILLEQKAVVLEKKRREELAKEQEEAHRREEADRRRIDAASRIDETEKHISNDVVADKPKVSYPPVDRSLKVDRSNKPIHLLATTTVDSPAANKYGFRSILVPDDTTIRFLKIAEPYTSRNVEFCGILAGRLAQHSFTLTHIVIPKQEGTSDSCTALNEEDMFDIMDNNDLITLGWIHTHPSQTAFLSSVDLHTHCPYQIMLPEALAIVCAPKHKQIGFFSLTPDHGLKFIAKCAKRGFHEHPKHPPLFEDGDHCQVTDAIRIEIIDLR